MNSIIVLDDEPANIYLIEGLLIENGYEVTSFTEPTKCLEYLKSNITDVLLLDLMMPGMSGLEVLDIIKANEDLKDIVVLMVTAKTDSKTLEDSFNRGAVDFIRKPYEEIELLARIRVAIELKEKEMHLKALLKQRDDFVRIISHDLRTPMTTIHGFAELILNSENVSDKQKESLQFIIDAAEYSNDYFNKLLSWVLIESGDIKIHLKTCNLKKLIESCLILFTYKIADKNLEVKIEIPPEINIQVDEIYFKQVINNLINNSIKFSYNGKKISIKLDKTEKGYVLRVIDEGTGIPEDTQHNLFKGSILKSSRGTSGEKGTGIGLYICHKILLAHNLGITCESEINKGASFNIHIPFDEVITE